MDKSIVGHDSQRQKLCKLYSAGRLPSAIMLSGISGVGKSLVAHELLRSLFCMKTSSHVNSGESNTDLYGGCGVCEECLLFESGNHPDLHVVDCLDKEIRKIAPVRELLYSLNLKAYRGAARAVLFLEAELLKEDVWNVLLKSLEEPRPATYFCLVTASPALIPATVLSRCQIWHFNRLSDSEIQSIMDRQGGSLSLPEGLGPKELALLANGSMEGLETIGAQAELWHELQDDLETISNGDVACAIHLANRLARDKESLRETFRLLRIAVRQKMRESLSPHKQLQWANTAANTLAAEYYICQRNLQAPLVFGNMFELLAAGASDEFLCSRLFTAPLLERIVSF